MKCQEYDSLFYLLTCKLCIVYVVSGLEEEWQPKLSTLLVRNADFVTSLISYGTVGNAK